MTLDTLVLASLAGIAVGVALTVLTVARLVGLARQPELARLPVAATASVTFDEPGRVELAVEGPLFTTRLRGLSFALVDGAGATVALRRLWLRTSSGGLSRTRLSLERATIPHPGRYELRTSGVDPSTDYARCAVVFVRPIGAELARTVIALLASIGLAGAGIATASALLLGGPRGGPPAPAALPATQPTPEGHGGRALVGDPRRLAGAQDVVWPVLQMRLRVPPDWIVRKLTATELDVRHPTTPSTFVVARATPMPAGPTVADYVQAQLDHARDQLEAGDIDGYATRRIDAVPGVLTVGRRDGAGAHLVTWTGFQPAAIGSVSVTLVAGAEDADFLRDETLLGAVIESVRFE